MGTDKMDTKQEQRNKENEEIREMGTMELGKKGNPYGIQLLTIIGEIEGHENVSGNTKATKYEHLLPGGEAEENDEIEGVLILLNTMGGDVEAGLGIAEMIASLGKPTVSLVLGGSHSIGGPLAVSADYSFYCPIRHDDYSSGAFFWNVHRSDPELSKYGAYPGPHYPLHCVPFSYLPGTDRGADAGFNTARERCRDNAGGEESCQRGNDR